MNNRVPNGRRRRSTDTTSLEEGRPDAVTPGPVWQVTSKTPSAVPGLLAEVLLAAPDVVGAGDVVAASAAVDPGGAVGVPVLWQPPNSIAPATAAVSGTRGVQRVMPTPQPIAAGVPRAAPELHTGRFPSAPASTHLRGHEDLLAPEWLRAG